MPGGHGHLRRGYHGGPLATVIQDLLSLLVYFGVARACGV